MELIKEMQTKDKLIEKNQVFCQIKARYPGIHNEKSKGMNLKKYPGFIILRSYFMLSLPTSGNINTYDSEFEKISFVCVYIIMSGKSQLLYFPI